MLGNGVGINTLLMIIQSHLIKTQPVQNKVKKTSTLVVGTASGELEPTIKSMKAAL